MSFPVRNISLAFICQTLALTSMTLVTTVTGLAGNSLAAHASYSTLPLAMSAVGTAFTAMPVAHLMQRIGRRPVMFCGALIGLVSSLLAAYAMLVGSFGLLTLAMGGIGVAMATSSFYRFFVAEITSAAARSRAVSIILLAGLLASFAGPWLAKASHTLFPGSGFAAPYWVIAGIWTAHALAISGFGEIPKTTVIGEEKVRALRLIISDRGYGTALIAGVAGSLIMGSLMISSPLAMVDCGFGLGDAATVLQWHYVAMFAPAFFTGDLIKKLGSYTIIGVGGAISLVAILTAIDTSFTGFWFSLLLIGLAWNFMNTGSVTLALTRYHPSEKGKAEGFYSLTMSLTSAVASLSAGYIQQIFGWHAVLFFCAFVLLSLLLAALIIHKYSAQQPLTPSAEYL